MAARRLFAAKGYRATRIADIAAEANVSHQTIYDSIGSKAEIVAGLIDGLDAEAGLDELIPILLHGDDPQEVIAAQLEITRRFVTRSGDIQRALAHGAGEPELRELRAEGRRRHRYGAGQAITRLDALDALPPDVDRERMADALAALTDGETILVFIDQYGWTVDGAIELLQRMITRELLQT
jgi:AcrR family transcriptional regulator